MNLIHRGRRDAYLEWGSAWVCLQERPARRPEHPTPGVDHVAFFIGPDDLEPAVERLRSCGVTIARGLMQRGTGWSVYFLDPDGTQLELHTSTLHERMQVWR